MRHTSRLALEAIQHQDSTTFKELTLAFRNIMEQKTSDYTERKRENEGLLEAIVKHRFNANCSVSFGEEFPAVRIFDTYHNNALIRNDHRAFFAQQLNFTKRFLAGGAARAGVDIMTGKLSGLFTELPFTIYMPDLLLEGGGSGNLRMSAEENAAMFLHEIGHFFTYCEMFSRTVSTNQALSAMVQALDGTYAVDRREVIIAKAVDDLKLKDVDVKTLAKIDKRSILETAIVTETAELSRSELGLSIYDSTAAEQLADQFATRFGAGVALVTALDRLNRVFGGGGYAYQSMPAFMLYQIFSIAVMFIHPITALLLVPINLIGILMGGLGDDGDNTYDTPEVRFRRVKMDEIQRLKNRNISDLEKKRTLADIAAIEDIMAQVHDKREWREYIATTVIPTYRRYRHTKQLQQQLEQLANNPLFVRAAELTVL